MYHEKEEYISLKKEEISVIISLNKLIDSSIFVFIVNKIHHPA